MRCMGQPLFASYGPASKGFHDVKRKKAEAVENFEAPRLLKPLVRCLFKYI
jgi:hypothetical protein